MSTTLQSWLRLAGETGLLLVMFGGILFGVQLGLPLIIPADFCAGTPVNPAALVATVAVWGARALDSRMQGFRPLLRLGLVSAVSILFAIVAAQIVAGCTSVDGWNTVGRTMIEIFVVTMIVVPVSYLHRLWIEPHWTRAIDENNRERRAENDRD